MGLPLPPLHRVLQHHLIAMDKLSQYHIRLLEVNHRKHRPTPCDRSLLVVISLLHLRSFGTSMVLLILGCFVILLILLCGGLLILPKDMDLPEKTGPMSPKMMGKHHFMICKIIVLRELPWIGLYSPVSHRITRAHCVKAKGNQVVEPWVAMLASH